MCNPCPLLLPSHSCCDRPFQIEVHFVPYLSLISFLALIMASFSEEDAQLLTTLQSEPQSCYHPCFWVDGHATCNKLVLGHEFSEHLRTCHVSVDADKARVRRRCWIGCSCEIRNESLIRHVQEKHLERKYTCPNCFERFTRSYTRDEHVSRKHSGS